MNKNLTWRELKAVHQLFVSGETKAKIQGNDYVEYVLRDQKKFVEPKFGKKEVLVVNEQRKNEFEKFYRKDFLENYNKYSKFLEELGQKVGDKTRLINYSRLKQFEIEKLIDIKTVWSNTQLIELKEQIENARENLQGVSRMFFKSPKYIQNSSNRQSLEVAVKALIGIDKFYENDKQYLYVLHCQGRKPKAIVLCENLYFLKFPHYANENDIELWYAGGNNITKLEKVPEIKYPIYYLCDWDYHGLKIYERVKDIINQLPSNNFEINLITPNGEAKEIKETEENHSSEWLEQSVNFSGLTETYYTEKQRSVIKTLIRNNEWIEEEDNDFRELINKLNEN
jgi:hypothetical protein